MAPCLDLSEDCFPYFTLEIEEAHFYLSLKEGTGYQDPNPLKFDLTINDLGETEPDSQTVDSVQGIEFAAAGSPVTGMPFAPVSTEKYPALNLRCKKKACGSGPSNSKVAGSTWRE